MARLFRSAVALAIFAFAGLATAESPMRRRQQMTTGALKDMLPAYKPDAELTMMQDAWRNGLDVMSVFTSNFQSEGMKAVLDNAEIQHTIMEKLPLLAAFDGFKQITGRRLDAEGTKAGFAAGINAMMTALPDMLKTMKDPTISTRVLSELLADDADGFSEVFNDASSGDKEAMAKVEAAVNEKLFPGINTSALKAVSEGNPLKSLLDNKEVMRLIDSDPVTITPPTAASDSKLVNEGHENGKRWRERWLCDGACRWTAPTPVYFMRASRKGGRERQDHVPSFPNVLILRLRWKGDRTEGGRDGEKRSYGP
ncbi:hypothetical protein VYU27_008827 [Nannochloropsis oceanica]